jgi:hypothetical protein
MALANAVIKMPSKVNPTPTKNNGNNSQTLSKRKETQQPAYPSGNSSLTPSKKIVYYCK